jgi:hypothetical protein
VDAAQALADLVEISSQIESAVLAEADGSVLATTLADEERAQAAAREGLALLEATAGDPTQIQVILQEGSVFVVRDEERLLVAVTGKDPTPGLVFYDLKTCLRLAGEPEPQKKAAAAPAARKRKTTKKDEQQEAAGEA